MSRGICEGWFDEYIEWQIDIKIYTWGIKETDCEGGDIWGVSWPLLNPVKTPESAEIKEIMIKSE